MASCFVSALVSVCVCVCVCVCVQCIVTICFVVVINQQLLTRLVIGEFRKFKDRISSYFKERSM